MWPLASQRVCQTFFITADAKLITACAVFLKPLSYCCYLGKLRRRLHLATALGRKHQRTPYARFPFPISCVFLPIVGLLLLTFSQQTFMNTSQCALADDRWINVLIFLRQVSLSSPSDTVPVTGCLILGAHPSDANQLEHLSTGRGTKMAFIHPFLE